MKTVFSSHEIAHVWASGSAPYGRSPGNASFDGDMFKSYATAIGRRVTHKGKTAYVLDSASFSNSTSKVQGRMRQALTHATTFFVREGRRGQSLSFTPATLRDYYAEQFKQVCAQLPSRYAAKRADQYMHATQMLQTAVDVCIFYGLPHKALDALILKRQVGQETAAETLKEAREKQLAAQDRKKAKEKADRQARAIATAENFLADVGGRTKRWVSPVVLGSYDDLLPAELRERFNAAVAAHNAGLSARWQAGEEVSLPYDSPTKLRAVGDEMETSRGAKVELRAARLAYAFACKHRVAGWHRNGETFAVGHYQLDAVNAEGIVAGCHRLKWAEVDRFAASQGWVKGGVA